jgi:hypothetical protein
MTEGLVNLKGSWQNKEGVLRAVFSSPRLRGTYIYAIYCILGFFANNKIIPDIYVRLNLPLPL